MRERGPLVGALLGVIAIAVVAGVLTLPREAPVAASPSPSPSSTATSSPGSTASPSFTPSASPTASPSPSPTAGRFVNADMGYAIDLTPPWHWADCGSGTIGSGSDMISADLFFTVSDYDLSSGHTGFPHDYISVSARSNPQGLTPRQWYAAGMVGQSLGDDLSDVTFAGRPALRVNPESYVFAHDARMFHVSGQQWQNSENTRAQRAAVLATFHLLSPEEIAAAKAVPTPAPPAPRSQEQVGDILAEGFAKKNVAILATVITTSCINQGVNEGGGSAMDDRRFLDELADRFRNGLVVEVRPRPITGFPGEPPTVVIGSVWKEPQNPDVEVDLMISLDGERWYWRGNLFYPGGRR